MIDQGSGRLLFSPAHHRLVMHNPVYVALAHDYKVRYSSSILRNTSG